MQKMNNKTKSMKVGLAGTLLAMTLLTSAVVGASTYTVKSGDTLSEIASANHTTVEHIADLNHISDINLITVGQVLELDATTEATTSSVSPNAVSTATSTDTTTTNTSSSSALSASDAAAKEAIAQRESSGSYTAQNGQYYGRYQLTVSYLNGDLSAENQERVADAYVASRYGSWSAALAFWNANGWY